MPSTSSSSCDHAELHEATGSQYVLDGTCGEASGGRTTSSNASSDESARPSVARTRTAYRPSCPGYVVHDSACDPLRFIPGGPSSSCTLSGVGPSSWIRI